MKTSKILKAIAMLFGLAIGASSCHDLKGDNSDFDFGYADTESSNNPYIGGYSRLDNSIRLATYNTHRCEGPITQNSSHDMAHYDMTAKVISLLSPDAIALQELDEKTTWHPVSQIQELAKRTGMHATFGRAIDQRGGQYGNGILSKEEPVSTDIISLPNPAQTEARIALVAEFEHFVFIATHFCHKSEINRTAAAAELNSYAEEHFKSYDKPVFLAGDLNLSRTGSDAFLELLKNWKIITSNDYTMSTGNTRIDYVLIYTGNQVSYNVLGAAVPTFSEIDVYTVSDHLPVFVDLDKK